MMNNKRYNPAVQRTNARCRRAFTSTGTIIILGVAGLLTAIALPTMQDHRRQTNIATAQQRMDLIVDALQEYAHEHCGHYPTSSQGLRTLSASAKLTDGSEGMVVLADVPVDSWGNTFLYISPGVMNRDGFDICSSGPDHILGTPDDITNWGAN